jgi:urea transport system ATP-binding protein
VRRGRALYVPQVGIINPSEMSPANSIEIAIWAAVGGRATLIGPIVGAFIVNGAKSWLTVAYPEFWLYFLGALFIGVTLFLPDGVVGLFKKLKGRECEMTPELMEAGAPRWRPTRPPWRPKKDNRVRWPRAGFSAWRTSEVDVTHGRILYLEDVSVSFDGFKAINNLSLDIAPGELRCIIGPNGAGKTTMMDIITGKTRPDSGTVFFGSTIDLLALHRAEIAQMGIGRKFQKPTVFEQLTVFENLELALKTNKGVKRFDVFQAGLGAGRPAGLGAAHHPPGRQRASRRRAMLSHGQKQWLEIGMLLMQDPKLLLLDEPVAGMTDEETERTAELFLTLKGQHSLMVVEHDMSFINTISDIVTVLCDGSVLAQGTLAGEVQADERVIEVYLRWKPASSEHHRLPAA